MKKIVLTLLFTGAVAMTMAQSTKTVKGAVIDKYGNPLPGAKIEATGGAERTVADADGTFSLEVSQWLKSLSVTYPGMKKKKMNIKNNNRDFIFTMTENRKHWFINAITQYSVFPSVASLGAGVMFGQLNTWGWYTKAVMNYYLYNFDDSKDVHRYDPTISVGMIKSLSASFYMYLGAGLTTMYKYYSDDYYNYYSYRPETTPMYEIGAIHRIGHFNLNYGGGSSFRRLEGCFHLGIGYSF